MTAKERILVGYDEVANFLKEYEFRITKDRLARLCSRGKGPPDEGKWGKKKRFLASKVLAWAYARVTGLLGRTRTAPVTVAPALQIGWEGSPNASVPQLDQRLLNIPDDELPPF